MQLGNSSHLASCTPVSKDLLLAGVPCMARTSNKQTETFSDLAKAKLNMLHGTLCPGTIQGRPFENPQQHISVHMMQLKCLAWSAVALM